MGGLEDGVFQDGSTDQLHITGQLHLRLLRGRALRDIRFTRTVATLGSSLEPYVGNPETLCESVLPGVTVVDP